MRLKKNDERITEKKIKYYANMIRARMVWWPCVSVGSTLQTHAMVSGIFVHHTQTLKNIHKLSKQTENYWKNIQVWCENQICDLCPQAQQPFPIHKSCFPQTLSRIELTLKCIPRLFRIVEFIIFFLIFFCSVLCFAIVCVLYCCADHIAQRHLNRILISSCFGHMAVFWANSCWCCMLITHFARRASELL